MKWEESTHTAFAMKSQVPLLKVTAKQFYYFVLTKDSVPPGPAAFSPKESHRGLH